jgi:hypothetical protein
MVFIRFVAHARIEEKGNQVVLWIQFKCGKVVRFCVLLHRKTVLRGHSTWAYMCVNLLLFSDP